ncbi:MAG: hypothetical protein KGL38_10580, partial [Gemmatimonadota bacterium]|nr:hypothetical protein [Gemmatimonadota bacterium]
MTRKPRISYRDWLDREPPEAPADAAPAAAPPEAAAPPAALPEAPAGLPTAREPLDLPADPFVPEP